MQPSLVYHGLTRALLCLALANKMENVIKSVFFTPCFKKFSFTDHILFKISTISPRHYNVPGKLCYWMIFLEDYGTWKWKFFIFKILVFSNLDAFPDKTYEKTCSFYNIFSKLISNFTRLTSFTIWITFRKKMEIVST